MSRLPVLDQLRVASPCSADWAEMTGTEAVRFCDQCEKHVYDLTVMSADEVVETIEATEGKFCGRLFRRHDGRVLTDDCPVGLARAVRRAKRRGYLAVAWAVGLAASAAAFVLYGDAASPKVFGPETPVTKVIETIETHTPPEPPPEPELMMGDIAVEPIEMGEVAIEPGVR